jgi:hypothetical protein
MKSLAFVLLASAAATSTIAATVTRWTPSPVASAQFESHPAFDPLTRDLYFVRSAPDFSGWKLLVSVCNKYGWNEPAPPSFAGDGLEADPWFTPDGRELYFISSRSTDGQHHADLDLWKVSRDRHGVWGIPQRLPEPLNSRAQEWFPRIGADGWLWFGSGRAGGLGKTDIWRARETSSGHWDVQNAGPAINTDGEEYEAEMSRDGKRLWINTADGFYESRFDGKAWRGRVKLPADVNANGSEVGALMSRSGHSILFARDTKAPDSGELFLWNDGKAERWPPVCAAAAPRRTP